MSVRFRKTTRQKLSYSSSLGGGCFKEQGLELGPKGLGSSLRV